MLLARYGTFSLEITSTNIVPRENARLYNNNNTENLKICLNVKLLWLLS